MAWIYPLPVRGLPLSFLACSDGPQDGPTRTGELQPVYLSPSVTTRGPQSSPGPTNPSSPLSPGPYQNLNQGVPARQEGGLEGNCNKNRRTSRTVYQWG